jgi:hypothetical protein
MKNCYTPKYLFTVEWSELFRDCLGNLREEHRIDERVFALDEEEACCKVADKNPDGYGFMARRCA